MSPLTPGSPEGDSNPVIRTDCMCSVNCAEAAWNYVREQGRILGAGRSFGGWPPGVTKGASKRKGKEEIKEKKKEREKEERREGDKKEKIGKST